MTVERTYKCDFCRMGISSSDPSARGFKIINLKLVITPVVSSGGHLCGQCIQTISRIT